MSCSVVGRRIVTSAVVWLAVVLLAGSGLVAPVAGWSYATRSPHGRLVHVTVLHRHGDRTPLEVNPSDRALWRAYAPGQLTPMGVAQAQALGRFLRETYIEPPATVAANLSAPQTPADFLPRVPPPQGEIRVQSTDVDRCLQSARAVLDTLYPMSSSVIASVPIHTVPQEMDTMLQSTDKCPSFRVGYASTLARLDRELKKDLAQVTLDDGHKVKSINLLAYTAAVTGWKDALRPTELITTVADNLACLQAHHLPIPPLLERTMPILTNASEHIAFEKFSASHFVRHWRRMHRSHRRGEPHRYHDGDEAFSREMDPRGSIGGVFARHIVQHWRDIAEAQAFDRNAKHQSTTDELDTDGQEHAFALPIRTRPVEARIKSIHRTRSRTDTIVSLTASDHEASQHAPDDATIAKAGADRPHPPPKPASTRARSPAHESTLAHERLMIYSAHDTTIFALMAALGEINGPRDAYVAPPYAASVTLELRSVLQQHTTTTDQDKEELHVNAYYGKPRRPERVSADERRSSDDEENAWMYARRPKKIRCLTEQDLARGHVEWPCSFLSGPESECIPRRRPLWQAVRRYQCSLNDFARYIAYITQSQTERALAETEADVDGHVGGRGPNSTVVFDFAAHDDETTGAHGTYTPTDGCCVKTSAYYALGCEASPPSATKKTITNNDDDDDDDDDDDGVSRGPRLVDFPGSAATECRWFRQKCPHNACPPGEHLNLQTLDCEACCTDASSRTNARTNATHEADVRTLIELTSLPPVASPSTAARTVGPWILLGFSAACLLGGVYAYWRALQLRTETNLLEGDRTLLRSGPGRLGHHTSSADTSDVESEMEANDALLGRKSLLRSVQL